MNSLALKRSFEMEVELSEAEQAKIREFALSIVNSFDASSKSRFGALLAQYLANSIKLHGLIKEVREIMEDVDQESYFTHLLQLFLSGDQVKKMYDYLLECGVHDFELPDSGKAAWQGSSPPLPFGGLIPTKPKKGSRKPPNKWTKEESQRLIELVETYGDKRWKKISQCIGGGKTGAQCAQHWKRVLCPEIRKGTWDVGEEENLLQLVAKYGQAWKKIAIELKTRTDIQCRYQYLKACMSREEKWGADEDKLLALKVTDFWKAEKEVSWLEIAKHLGKAKRTKIPRTALECKARWSEISDRDDILFLTSKTREPFQVSLSYATAKPVISQRVNASSSSFSSLTTSTSSSTSSSPSSSSSCTTPPLSDPLYSPDDSSPPCFSSLYKSYNVESDDGGLEEALLEM